MDVLQLDGLGMMGLAVQKCGDERVSSTKIKGRIDVLLIVLQFRVGKLLAWLVGLSLNFELVL